MILLNRQIWCIQTPNKQSNANQIQYFKRETWLPINAKDAFASNFRLQVVTKADKIGGFALGTRDGEQLITRTITQKVAHSLAVTVKAVALYAGALLGAIVGLAQGTLAAVRFRYGTSPHQHLENLAEAIEIKDDLAANKATAAIAAWSGLTHNQVADLRPVVPLLSGHQIFGDKFCPAPMSGVSFFKHLAANPGKTTNAIDNTLALVRAYGQSLSIFHYSGFGCRPKNSKELVHGQCAHNWRDMDVLLRMAPGQGHAIEVLKQTWNKTVRFGEHWIESPTRIERMIQANTSSLFELFDTIALPKAEDISLLLAARPQKSAYMNLPAELREKIYGQASLQDFISWLPSARTTSGKIDPVILETIAKKLAEEGVDAVPFKDAPKSVQLQNLIAIATFSAMAMMRAQEGEGQKTAWSFGPRQEDCLVGDWKAVLAEHSANFTVMQHIKDSQTARSQNVALKYPADFKQPIQLIVDEFTTYFPDTFSEVAAALLNVEANRSKTSV